MAIKISKHVDQGYFTSTFEGKVTDSELLEFYEAFVSGGEWDPSLNELVDLSRADLRGVTRDGLSELLLLANRHFKLRGVVSTKTAIYAPADLPYGIARMYATMVEQSPEEVRVFRDIDLAADWVRK